MVWSTKRASLTPVKPGDVKAIMFTKNPPKAAGFTIIETLIVIAVAGLIFLMVFEAIPSLERNSRNNQRKQDIQTILEAVSHWELNNSGTIPDPSLGNNFLQYTPPRYYDPTNIAVHVTPDGGGASAPQQTDTEKVDIYNHEKCDTIGTASSQGAGYYDVVAMYAIEASAGSAARCQQL
jgi:type II secretory pathway pseudopilin PulG